MKDKALRDQAIVNYRKEEKDFKEEFLKKKTLAVNRSQEANPNWHTVSGLELRKLSEEETSGLSSSILRS